MKTRDNSCLFPKPTVGDKSEGPVLLLPAQNIDQAYLVNELVINVKVTTPGGGDDSELVLLIPVKIDFVWLPVLGS